MDRGLAIWRDLGEVENAGEAYLQLVNEALSGEVDKTLLDTISVLGIFCDNANWLEKGLKITEKCLEMHQKMFGEEHPKTLLSVKQHGCAAFKHGKQ